MQIYINKKYRYRNGQPARVLCVDGPCMHMAHPQPVMSMDESGKVIAHYPTGRFRSKTQDCDLDLIEVREPREWTMYADPDQYSHLPFPGAKAVRVREILD